MQTQDLVLVIDDDHETLQLLQMALKRARFRVLTAASWEDVQDRIQLTYTENTPIDVIVLDLMMPGRSGFDIYRAIKQKLVRMPPVIMLTAVTGMQQRVEARDLGAARYLTKPTTPSKLVETIHEVLQAARDGQSATDPVQQFPPKRFSG